MQINLFRGRYGEAANDYILYLMYTVRGCIFLCRNVVRTDNNVRRSDIYD